MALSETLKFGLKLGVAGATIFAIGAAIIVSGDEGEVGVAEADVADVVAGNVFWREDFGRVVEGSGLKPRPYEINGNQVFFAVDYSKKTPYELLDAYQEKFVEAGINEKKFTEIPRGKYQRTLDNYQDDKFKLAEEDLEYNEAMLTGGVVPLEMRPGYVAMGGMVPKDKAQNLKEVFEDWEPDKLGQMDANMEGWRFIDAQAVGSASRVTSVWSEGDFDFKAMGNPGKSDIPPIMVTPPCIGCRVGMQMRSLDPKEKFRIGHYYTQRGTSQVTDFYETAMKTRGFKLSDASKAVEYARHFIDGVPNGSILSYSKGNVDSWIAVMPENGQTSVMVVEGF